MANFSDGLHSISYVIKKYCIKNCLWLIIFFGVGFVNNIQSTPFSIINIFTFIRIDIYSTFWLFYQFLV